MQKKRYNIEYQCYLHDNRLEKNKIRNMKIKISAVSYLNSLPFVWGLNQSEYIRNNTLLQLDIPSDCAKNLLNKKVDIGLVPVAILPQLSEYQIISDYCIGANGKVATVLLLSDVPLDEIKIILLDYHSRTSVRLVQILAREYWKITPKWIDAKQGFENQIGGTTAAVLIGDRTFIPQNLIHNFIYDLAHEWKNFTKLPFVFALWIATGNISTTYISEFNKALKLGIENIEKVIETITNNENIRKEELKKYYTENISYLFDNEKQTALNLFLNKLKLYDTNF